ncbi:MAG: peptidyl-alpha-hydroxyglycine alpha-amidating lyase family protein [Deltaproteobacteria bacterium]
MLVVLLASAVARGPEKIEFVPLAGFPQLPSGVTLGRCSAVGADSRDRVYLFHRGKSPVLCFDRDGKFIRAWGDDLIKTAHGLRIDRDDNIWVTDIGRHLVLKFSPQGKLLLSLGTADKPGTGLDQFDRPTDVAFGPAGEAYVSDGYGNSRVMVFDTRGKFVKTCGKRGKESGEFNLPHCIRVDSQKRVLVGDRENKRIQVFDREGKVLAIWDGFAPYGLEIDRDGTAFVADGLANRIFQLDDAGKIVHAWGGKGAEPGQFNVPHMLATDSAGNLFVTEIDGMRLQKFARNK